MLAHYLGYLQPLMFQLTKSTEMTIMVIFGGLGSISGSVIGAFILTFLPEIFREFSMWRLVVYGAAIILIMITRPQGMMGGIEFTDIYRNLKSWQARRKQRKSEMKKKRPEEEGAEL